MAAFNAAGIEVIELDPLELLLLDTACIALIGAGDVFEGGLTGADYADVCAVVAAIAASRAGPK